MKNIDLDQFLRIATALSAAADAVEAPKAEDTGGQPFVVVRCRGAGVHAGYLVSHDRDVVKLRSARRLWKWQVPANAPAFLSGVATDGLDHSGSKVGAPIDVTLIGACELIVATANAVVSINSAPIESRSNG